MKEEKKVNKNDEISKRDKYISLDTMKAVGKEVVLAGRKYTVAPIALKDLDILDTGLILPIIGNKDIEDIYFSNNITDPEKAKVFYYIVEKYTKYEDGSMPVNQKLIDEHNWSIKDIRKFLEVWLQVSD